jgi:hypothetical protein
MQVNSFLEDILRCGYDSRAKEDTSDDENDETKGRRSEGSATNGELSTLR